MTSSQSSSAPVRASDTLRSAAAGLSAYFVYQVSARLLSFIIKAIVIRALKPAQFAFTEIRVVLLVNLALLPAIHGFRPVTLRLQSDDRASALAFFNSLFTFTLGIVLGFFAIALDRENALSLAIVISSVLIRAFVELPVVFLRRRQLYFATSRARAASIVVSGVTQALAVSLVTKQVYASPASMTSHVTYVIALGTSMMYSLGTSAFPNLSFSHLKRHLHREDLLMATIATGEGFIKFLLENGEAIILDITCASHIKGAYKIAANLGSVFARFFSEALEEQALNVFSRLSGAFRGKADANTLEMRKSCVETLILGLKSAITVSLLFTIVGPPFSYAIIRLLYGTEWADGTPAPQILATYLVYVLFMAGNGVSEAFVTSSASTAELKSRSKFTLSLSIAYIACLYEVARRYGAEGVVVVNCVNMAIRTLYSSWFFTKLTGHHYTDLFNALPRIGVVTTLFAARLLASWSEHRLLGPASARIFFTSQTDMLIRIGGHGLCGVLTLVLFVFSMLLFEKDFINRIKSLRAHKD